MTEFEKKVTKERGTHKTALCRIILLTVLLPSLRQILLLVPHLKNSLTGKAKN